MPNPVVYLLLLTLGNNCLADQKGRWVLDGDERVDGEDYCYNELSDFDFVNVKYGQDDRFCNFACYLNQNDYYFFIQPNKIDCGTDGMCLKGYCYDKAIATACYEKIPDMGSILTYGAGICKKAACTGKDPSQKAYINQEDGTKCFDTKQNKYRSCQDGNCVGEYNDDATIKWDSSY